MSQRHEHQQLFQCGRHALNNLCGEEWATTASLTAIAQELRAAQEEQGINLEVISCIRLCVIPTLA